MHTATAITNVRIFDGKQLGAPATVVLADGHISARPAPDAAKLINGMGGALLPGFIDTHAHVSAESQLRACAEWG
jgi:imidazolonepropionase-like amidohydrolase